MFLNNGKRAQKEAYEKGCVEILKNILSIHNHDGFLSGICNGMIEMVLSTQDD